MIGYSYTYLSAQDIFAEVGTLQNIGVFEGIFTISIIFVILSSIFFIIPLIYMSYIHINIEKSKRNKKKILTQILLQKEIEDEVEKEIKIEEESKTK